MINPIINNYATCVLLNILLETRIFTNVIQHLQIKLRTTLFNKLFNIIRITNPKYLIRLFFKIISVAILFVLN